MKVYSYVISRDFGFAPNPFYGICTLATCKPLIRKHCCVGDYVIGISPLDKGRGNKLVMLMRVTEVTTFDEYWSNPRFECKKPVMNGSLMKLYGDNIYHHDEQGNWTQEDSHHTNADGTPNPKNLKRDTGTTDRVLISAEHPTPRPEYPQTHFHFPKVLKVYHFCTTFFNHHHSKTRFNYVPAPFL